MAFWGVKVKPGEPYAHESSGRGRLRITQATLGDLDSVGWSTIACSAGGMMPVKFCALSSISGTYRLDLEYEEEQNVVFSVVGDSSIHLTGYYKIPDAAANVQPLVTQSQEADGPNTTHVHDIPQECNAVAANVQPLVTQSQEADDPKTTHVHDILQERNAVDTEVRNDGTNQMVQLADLNTEISDGHRLGYKEAVGGPIDKLGIEELESGDSNAEMASVGKKVKVKYIGMLKNGKVIDGPDIYIFTLGVDQLIAGWHQGIQGMHVGGKRKLTIPPALAYKDEPQKTKPDEPQKVTIPANSWLIYEIELLEVWEPDEEKPKKKHRSVKYR